MIESEIARLEQANSRLERFEQEHLSGSTPPACIGDGCSGLQAWSLSLLSWPIWLAASPCDPATRLLPHPARLAPRRARAGAHPLVLRRCPACMASA